MTSLSLDERSVGQEHVRARARARTHVWKKKKKDNLSLLFYIFHVIMLAFGTSFRTWQPTLFILTVVHDCFPIC